MLLLLILILLLLIIILLLLILILLLLILILLMLILIPLLLILVLQDPWYTMQFKLILSLYPWKPDRFEQYTDEVFSIMAFFFVHKSLHKYFACIAQFHHHKFKQHL